MAKNLQTPVPRNRPASSCIMLEGERTSADQAFSIRRAIPRSGKRSTGDAVDLRFRCLSNESRRIFSAKMAFRLSLRVESLSSGWNSWRVTNVVALRASSFHY